jgi:hypothetical protein
MSDGGGGTTDLTMTFAGETWTATDIDCDGTITFDDTSNPTGWSATIVGSDATPCVCACDLGCEYCIDELATTLVEVTISDLDDGDCENCVDVNGTHTLEWGGCFGTEVCCANSRIVESPGVYWRVNYASPTLCGNINPGDGGTSVGFFLLRDSGTGTWYAAVKVTAWQTESPGSGCTYDDVGATFYLELAHTGTEIDCQSFSYSGFTACNPSDDEYCDASSATASVVSL